MTFQLKVEETTYDLWLGGNAPILLFEVLGISLDDALTNAEIITDALTPQNLFNKIKTFETRKGIASIILQEGETTPALSMDVGKLARRLELTPLLTLISDVFTEYNERQTAIAPQPELTFDELTKRIEQVGVDPEQPSLQEISEAVKEVRTSRKSELPLEAIAPSNIAEGE